MTNLFHDWEFIVHEGVPYPISVAVVAEHGDQFYHPLSLSDVALHWALDDQFVRTNVMHHIFKEEGSYRPRPSGMVRAELIEFIRSFENPVLWADYSAFDHVTMTNLMTLGRTFEYFPPDIPFVTHDIQTLRLMCQTFGADIEYPPIQSPETLHHALFDAHHDHDLYNYYMTALEGVLK